MGPLRSRRAWAWNAWVTAALLLGVVVAGNRLAKGHLRARIDLSEEKLFAPSPVAERMLGSLEDVLSVHAYFTGDVKHGPVQLAKSRLLDQLGEYEDAARGRLRLTFSDPNASSEARLEAQRLGVEPVPLRAVQGTSELTQEVYLGLVLRYRGREAVLPFVLPQSFAYGFLSELATLVRDAVPSVGFVAGDPFAIAQGDAADDGFGEARARIGGRYTLVELDALADGEPIDPAIGLVVVARPRDLHPRAAFALDQHVQRGGNLLVLTERVHIDLAGLQATLIESGLDGVLDAWGVAVTDELVFDQEANWLSIPGVGRTQYPFWVNVGEGGMDRSVPVAGRLPGADLFWTHALSGEAVEGVRRTGLVRSSESSWLVDPAEALRTDGQEFNARGVELRATEAGRPRDLVVALEGRFPSAFAAAGAPEPRDAVADALWREARSAALTAGEPPPPRPGGHTDEPVQSGGGGGTVVVAADADWALSGKFFTTRNQLLFDNLIDWLSLEHELVELRANLPRERRITDLLTVEKERRGLPVLEGSGALALEGVDPALLAEAEGAAERKRWTWMALATGGALLLAAACAFLARLVVGRTA